VAEWEPQDDPWTEHCKLFPHCPFVRGENVGNVPIDQTPTPLSMLPPSRLAPPAASHIRAASTSTASAPASSDESMDVAVSTSTVSEDETGIRPRRQHHRDINSGPERGERGMRTREHSLHCFAGSMAIIPWRRKRQN